MACVSIPAIAAIGAAGIGAASSAGAFSPGMPSTPKYSKIAEQTLQGQIAMAPAQFSAEANPNFGQPAYAGLQLQDLNTLLNGTPGGPSNTYTQTAATQNGWYGADGTFLGNDKTTTPPGATWVKSGQMVNVTTPGTSAATPGLIAQQATANTAQRTADINDVTNLGPSATSAMINADPYNAALLAKLNGQANTELDAGSSLTPDQQRAMQQSSRAAFAARGMGGGNSAVASELLSQFNLGNQLLQQRQQFAQSLIGTNQSVTGDPSQLILGRSSGSIPAATQALSQSGPQIFNPQAGLGLATSNFSTQAQEAAANNPLSNLSGETTLVNNAFAGLGKAFGGSGGTTVTADPNGTQTGQLNG